MDTILEVASDEFNQQVCEKYNTSLQQVRKDVRVLREWISQQPHLPQNSSEPLLTNFLIACKNSMERAKDKIDKYYTARLTFPDFFGDRDIADEKCQQIAKEVRISKLPKFTPDGCRVTVFSLVTGDADKFDYVSSYKLLLACEDIRLDVEPFCMGNYLIADCKLFTASHFLRANPLVIKDFMYCVQDVFPAIVKGVIAINAPSYIELFMKIAKPFIKKKIFQRIHIHTEGPEILNKYFPLKMLPSDFGGEEKSTEELNETWKQLLRLKRDWLMSEGAVTVDEKKRIGDSSYRKHLDHEGILGSFKTLCID